MVLLNKNCFINLNKNRYALGFRAILLIEVHIQ